MLLESIAAMALLSQTQETSCGWEYNRWVCRTPAPVTQVQPYEGLRHFRESYETMAMIDRDRRERAERERASAPPPRPLPPATWSGATPADMYVSCRVTARDGSSEDDICALAGMAAITYREGRIEGEEMRFCLPEGARGNPIVVMASAYVAFYDQHAPQHHTDDGMLAFTAAMINRWPCAA